MEGFESRENVADVAMDVANVATKTYQPLEKRDIFYQKALTTIQKMERFLVRVGYVAEDTQKIKEKIGKIESMDKKIEEISQAIKRPREHRLIVALKAVALIMIILVTGGMFIYGYFVFDKLLRW